MSKSPFLSDIFAYKSPLQKSNLADVSFLPPQLDLSDSVSLSANFKGEPNRYQLFLNEANPLCHIINIVATIKGLDDIVYINFVRHDECCKHTEEKGCAECEIQITCIKINKFARTMRHLFKNDHFPVPLLYDNKTEKIVSTESDVIVEFLNADFNEHCSYPEIDLNPLDEEIQEKMTKVQKKVLASINQSIGRAGRAKSLEEFEAMASEIKEGLAEMEKILSRRRYLCGDIITEIDLIEFVSLFRWDPLISWAFTDRVCIRDSYPEVWGWLQDIYQTRGVAETCDLTAIYKSQSFYQSFGVRIIELGVELQEDWDMYYLEELAEEHGRDPDEVREREEEAKQEAEEEKEHAHGPDCGHKRQRV